MLVNLEHTTQDISCGHPILGPQVRPGAQDLMSQWAKTSISHSSGSCSRSLAKASSDLTSWTQYTEAWRRKSLPRAYSGQAARFREFHSENNVALGWPRVAATRSSTSSASHRTPLESQEDVCGQVCSYGTKQVVFPRSATAEVLTIRFEQSGDRLTPTIALPFSFLSCQGILCLRVALGRQNT